MNLINPVSERADRFERLFNTTFALLHKIQEDYDQIRKHNSFYAFVLPAAVFQSLQQDFEELYAMIQILKVELGNISEGLRLD
jgi:hypothetical protein